MNPVDQLTTDHEYYRAEFDWLAVDEGGEMALLSSAGSGPVPGQALEDCDFLEGIVEYLLRLRETGAATARSGRPIPKEFWEIARRGVYLFRWNDMKGDYELLVAPDQPLRSDDESAGKVGIVARRVRLPVRFRSGRPVPADVRVDR